MVKDFLSHPWELGQGFDSFKRRAVDLSKGSSSNGIVHYGCFCMRSHMGGDSLPRFPSTLVNKIHACMVLNSGKLNCLCSSTFQCTEDATTYFSRGCHGCSLCSDEEPCAVHVVTQPVECICIFRSNEVTPYKLQLDLKYKQIIHWKFKHCGRNTFSIETCFAFLADSLHSFNVLDTN